MPPKKLDKRNYDEHIENLTNNMITEMRAEFRLIREEMKPYFDKTNDNCNYIEKLKPQITELALFMKTSKWLSKLTIASIITMLVSLFVKKGGGN